MALDLRVTFRRGPHLEALLNGGVSSERLNLEFIPVEPISRAFRRAIRDSEFDVSEMALVTLAMAVDAGYPWMGLPVVLMRGFHHGALRTAPDSGIHGPQDLAGRRVGVRAYSQTTGVWVRGLLEQDYSIGLDRILWLTTEDAHVPGFPDPPFVIRVPSGVSLQQLLESGDLAAAVGDGSSPLPDTRSVISEPEKAAAEWHGRTGVYPVNHVMAVRKDLLEREPWVASELERMFEKARDLWLANTQTRPADDLPYGREVHEESINLCLKFAFAQRLTRRQLRYEDLF